jgi:oligopeptidase B
MERENGLPRIVVRDRASGEEHAIAFDEEAYSLGLMGSYEYDTDIIRFSYSSMTTPVQVFDYDMRTRERTLLKRRRCRRATIRTITSRGVYGTVA